MTRNQCHSRFNRWESIPISCPSVLSRKFVEELAPEERHNLAHGVEPWVERPPPSPLPLSRPCGIGGRRRGEGLRTQGWRPGLRYSAPNGATTRSSWTRTSATNLRLSTLAFYYTFINIYL